MAETHYMPRISIGGRAGMSMAEVTFSPAAKEAWAMGTTGAVTFRYTEEKLFGLVMELGWVQRGWKEDFEGAPVSYDRTLTYLDLPIMTHIYFGTKRFKCFVNLGPEVSYLINDHISSNFDYTNPTSDPRFPTKSRYTEQMAMEIANKLDYGICGGIGFEFYVAPRHSILLEGRYYFGLGNIYPATKADFFGASRNMSIEITLGYNFLL